jgi:hypothetical protein
VGELREGDPAIFGERDTVEVIAKCSRGDVLVVARVDVQLGVDDVRVGGGGAVSAGAAGAEVAAWAREGRRAREAKIARRMVYLLVVRGDHHHNRTKTIRLSTRF